MKFNHILSIVLLFLFVNITNAQPWNEHGKLQVSKVNPHYLAFQDGKPFFWLADTGWEMLHKLNREEIEQYLENRKNKGFNVIQTVLISEFIHMDKPTNFYNDSIFLSENPEKPAVTVGNNPQNENEYDFWDHVDFAVKTAEEKGLYLAMLPTWGEWVTPRSGKALFNTKEQAYNYGWFVGNRYRNSPNVIWILGGDRQPDERAIGIELWRTMAEGIADGTNNIKKQDGKADYSTTLMTFHSFSSSSKWFHKDDWIDFHAWGSYHAEVNNTKAYLAAIADWNLPNPKPTINLEPCYEAMQINYAIADNGVFTSTDVRIAAYWSVFSGTAGFTYGANTIWKFISGNESNSNSEKSIGWKDELNLPGAFQMGYLRKLMESHPMLELIPDQSMIIAGQGDCANRTCAIRGKSFAYIYIPTGNQTTIKMGMISGEKVKASWFNPKNGETNAIGEFENTGEHSFDVPSMSKELGWLRSGRGCDWVLVIEDASK